jgi:undecaprenyl-diphosphatase
MTQHLLTRAILNIQTWINVILRPPRPRFAKIRRRPRVWIVGGSIVFIAGLLTFVMFTIDAWAITEMRRLPRPLVAIFDEITDFGKSGWLLFPLAIAMLCSAALPATLPQSR